MTPNKYFESVLKEIAEYLTEPTDMLKFFDVVSYLVPKVRRRFNPLTWGERREVLHAIFTLNCRSWQFNVIFAVVSSPDLSDMPEDWRTAFILWQQKNQAKGRVPVSWREMRWALKALSHHFNLELRWHRHRTFDHLRKRERQAFCIRVMWAVRYIEMKVRNHKL